MYGTARTIRSIKIISLKKKIGDGWNSGVQQSSEEPTAAVSTMSRDMQALLKNFEQGSQLQELRKSLANSQQSLMHSESFINQASQEWFK